MPLGIAANELITNACKYSGTGAEFRVVVRLAAQPQAPVLTLSDTGPGVPIDFCPNNANGLGRKAVNVLVRQIGGTVASSKAGGEARFEIAVPLTGNSPVD